MLFRSPALQLSLPRATAAALPLLLLADIATAAACAPCTPYDLDEPEPPDLAAIDRTVTECDRLTAWEYDTNRVAPPVDNTEIYVLHRAEAACRQALAEQPNNPRLMFQLARALTLRPVWKEGVNRGFGWEEVVPEVHQLLLAAEHIGYPAAQYFLYHLYDESALEAKDHVFKLNVIKRAAQSGDRYAQYELAGELLLSCDKDEQLDSMGWYEKSSAQGNASANASLAWIYQDGKFGVRKNTELALSYYRKAAELGGKYYQSQLANLLLDGVEGLDQDIGEGIYWLEKAADAGDQASQIKLGDMYYDGRYVSKNDTRARHYYCMIEAHERADFLYRQLTGNELLCPPGSRREEIDPWWADNNVVANAVDKLRDEQRVKRQAAKDFRFEDYFVATFEDGYYVHTLDNEGNYGFEVKDYPDMESGNELIGKNEDGVRAATAALYESFPRGSKVADFRQFIEHMGGECYESEKEKVDALECRYMHRDQVAPSCLTGWTIFVFYGESRDLIERLRTHAFPCVRHRHF